MSGSRTVNDVMEATRQAKEAVVDAYKSFYKAGLTFERDQVAAVIGNAFHADLPALDTYVPLAGDFSTRNVAYDEAEDFLQNAIDLCQQIDAWSMTDQIADCVSELESSRHFQKVELENVELLKYHKEAERQLLKAYTNFHKIEMYTERDQLAALARRFFLTSTLPDLPSTSPPVTKISSEAREEKLDAAMRALCIACAVYGTDGEPDRCELVAEVGRNVRGIQLEEFNGQLEKVEDELRPLSNLEGIE